MKTRIAALSCWACLCAFAQSPQFRNLWSDPELVQRIDTGIQANRMGWATVRVLDAAGQPASGAKISIEQTRHHFLFGANLFMLGGFPSEADNRRYEQSFLGLFNYGTAAFYWKTLEPQLGELRFTAGSPAVYRRPPPDVAVDFARRSGITLKGHPLVWDNPTWSYPDWAPRDPAAMDHLIRQRIEKIAARYRDSFAVWDVVNEVFQRQGHMAYPMPEDFVFRAFTTAAKVFPVDAKLTLNEASNVWTNFQDETSPFYLLIQNLLLRGAALNTIGMQMHFFNEDGWRRTLEGSAYQPMRLLRVLDRYADFRLPIHITEITIPTLPNTPEGEAAQAEMARNLYRLWFSHPAVEGITWWNLVDDTAAPGEDKWRGGLMRRDFSAKPAHAALQKLIHDEWHTRLQRTTAGSGEARFQGFYGQYRATIELNGKTRTVEFGVSKGAPNVTEVRL